MSPGGGITELWRSDETYEAATRPTITTTPLGQGKDIAIVVDTLRPR